MKLLILTFLLFKFAQSVRTYESTTVPMDNYSEEQVYSFKESGEGSKGNTISFVGESKRSCCSRWYMWQICILLILVSVIIAFSGWGVYVAQTELGGITWENFLKSGGVIKDKIF